MQFKRLKINLLKDIIEKINKNISKEDKNYNKGNSIKRYLKSLLLSPFICLGGLKISNLFLKLHLEVHRNKGEIIKVVYLH